MKFKKSSCDNENYTTRKFLQNSEKCLSSSAEARNWTDRGSASKNTVYSGSCHKDPASEMSQEEWSP